MHVESVLECQMCGKVLRYLDDAEAQRVARNPYNFISYCGRECRESDPLLFDNDYGVDYGDF